MIYILILLLGLSHLYETIVRALIVNHTVDTTVSFKMESSISEIKKILIKAHMENIPKTYAYSRGCELFFAIRVAIAASLIWHGISNLI